MPVFNPTQLAAWTSGTWTSAPSSPLIGFTMDTRRLRAGEVFVALVTDKRDGHDFLAVAEAGGAGAALVSRPNPALALPQLVVADPLAAFQAIAREHRRAFTGPVIGISGSAGKTSTKNLLALLLGGEAGGVLSTEGNLNNHLGVPLTLTRLDHQRHRAAVIEAGIGGPGEMAPLASMIEPDVAIITLIAPAHVEALGSLDGVAREKAVLPAALKAAGIAVFPRQAADFTAFRELGVRTLVIERADVLRPTEPPKDRIYYTITHRGEETAVGVAYGPPPPLVFTFRRVSDGMAQNAVLAICAALWLATRPSDVQARLAQWQPAKLRGELRREGERWLYVDCYNANPASMADALATFAQLAPSAEPRLYVLGGMEELGRDAAHYHRQLGASLALRPQDRAMVIGGEAEAVRAGALAAGLAEEQIEVVSSLEPMRARFAEFRGAVFIKGSRRYQLENILAGEAAAAAAH